jgi:PKD repeat protein
MGQDKNLNYTFTDTGRYEVRYIAAINSRQDTVTKTIHIYPKINKHFLGKDTIYAKGTPFKKELSAPYGMHCQLWQDSSGLSTFQADTAGRYTCKVITQSFCEVIDTIEIKECINTLTIPSIYRIQDSLYTYQQVADSFIWFKNNVQLKITKAAAIRVTDTGTYRVEAAKKDHCNRSSANFRIEKLGLRSIHSQAIGIHVFPNPANETVLIEASTDFSLLVTDATGKTILASENTKALTLATGIYYFRFTVNSNTFFEKVVVLN